MLLYAEQGALALDSELPALVDARTGVLAGNWLTIPEGGSALATNLLSPVTVRRAVAGRTAIYPAVLISPLDPARASVAAAPATIPSAGYRPELSAETGLVAVPASPRPTSATRPTSAWTRSTTARA